MKDLRKIVTLGLLSLLLVLVIIPQRVSASESEFSVTECVKCFTVNTKHTLNVRKGPSTDYPVVGSLDSGTEIVSMGECDDWYQVKLSNGTIGFVFGKYLIEVEEEPEIDVVLTHHLSFDELVAPQIALIICIILMSILCLRSMTQIITLSRKLKIS